MSLGNVTFSSKFAKKDNGERTIYWVPIESRLPPENDYYHVTMEVTSPEKLVSVYVWFDGEEFYNDEEYMITERIIAWAKGPSPYNPN